jgi:hypothetical protein
VLSRLGPLGLSVLSLLAAFVIVLTAGGVLATSSNPAPPAPTPTKAPKLTTVDIDIAALQAGGDVDAPEGVKASLPAAAPPPLGTGNPTAPSGPGMSTPATRLCLTLSDRWSLWDPSRVWTKDGMAYCRSIDPQQPEITVVLESTR